MHRNLSRSSSGTDVIEGLVEHPLVELQERELAVDVVLGRLEIRSIHRYYRPRRTARPAACKAARWYQRRMKLPEAVKASV